MTTDYRVAVITPYHREPRDMLRQTHESVLAQDLAADHFLVADGHAQAAIDDWPVHHVKLPAEHGDNGNTPRGIGSLLAKRAGYDFIAYLDADNWFHPGHLRSLVALWEETASPVCASFRTFHDAAGQQLDTFEEDEDALLHIDTSCLLIHRSGFASLPIWLDMPPALSPICDRVFLAGLIHHKLRISSTRARTVAFRSRYAAHYAAAGRPAPAGALGDDYTAPITAFLRSGDGVTQCVSALGFWPPSYVEL